MKLVYSVKRAVLRLGKLGVARIYVSADGEVVSSGWSASELSARVYIAPPADGIQEFDFLARPPSGGITLPVLTPISALATSPADPANYWGPGKPLKGVRVYAQTNQVEARPEDFAAHDGPIDPVPWPWLHGWATGGCGTPDILGMSLRVYNAGDPVTDDYLKDRANIELDPGTRRIARIWVG